MNFRGVCQLKTHWVRPLVHTINLIIRLIKIRYYLAEFNWWTLIEDKKLIRTNARKKQ